MGEKEKGRHAKNSNLLGNLYRMEEMAEGGLSAEEQEAVFAANGINVPDVAIRSVLPVLPALRNSPLSRGAVQSAIENHNQIVAEHSDVEDDGENDLADQDEADGDDTDINSEIVAEHPDVGDDDENDSADQDEADGIDNSSDITTEQPGIDLDYEDDFVDPQEADDDEDFDICFEPAEEE